MQTNIHYLRDVIGYALIDLGTWRITIEKVNAIPILKLSTCKDAQVPVLRV